MRRALPVLAVSAAGLTWLLRTQGVIDAGSQTESLTTGVAPAAAGATPVEGIVAVTPFGPVQVAAVVRASHLDDVRALKLPDADANSKRIDADAVPELRESAIKAQSAKIDTVAGATFTSDAYKRSLQSALDNARFSSGSGGGDELAAGETTTSTETTSTTSTTILLNFPPPPVNGPALNFPPPTTARPGDAGDHPEAERWW